MAHRIGDLLKGSKVFDTLVENLSKHLELLGQFLDVLGYPVSVIAMLCSLNTHSEAEDMLE